jgi:hypothetical protein
MRTFTESLPERQAAMRERRAATSAADRMGGWPPVKREPPAPSAAVQQPAVITPASPIVLRPWPPLMGIDMAAEYAGVSRTTVKEWHLAGQLRSHTLPGIRGRRDLDKVVFERRVLDRFLGLKSE